MQDTRMAEQKQDDQLEHTYSSYVSIRDVAKKTCQKRWTIGRSGERGSEISVLAARYDDDDDDSKDFASFVFTGLRLVRDSFSALSRLHISVFSL